MSFSKDARRLWISYTDRLVWIGLGSVLAFPTAFAHWIAITSHAAGESVLRLVGVADELADHRSRRRAAGKGRSGG